MVKIDSYTIGYPQLKHPLVSEKVDLKQKYIYLLRYFAEKYCHDKQATEYRIQMLIKILFKEGESSLLSLSADNRSAFHAVMKSRFTPFRLFSYRYVFLFDCLIIIAADNEKVGNLLCNDIKSSVKKRYHQAFDKMRNQMYAGVDDYAEKELISDDMIEAWNTTRKYLTSENKNIMFTATMSAGKSTLINGIIGRELSYAKKAACTATVMKIITSPSQSDFMTVYCNGNVQTMKKEQEIREFTKGLTKPCSICGFFLSPITECRVTLIDTPGVNSSLNPAHKKITRNELTGSDIDVLVYVIPVENYGSEGDFEHLNFIRKKVRYQKIMFVVNMIDSCDFEDDSVDEIMSDIKEHLENIGYANPLVCPMSAKAGMLIKQALYGTLLSENDREACKTYIEMFQKNELALARFYSNVEMKSATNDITWLQMNPESVWYAFLNTGLPGFEAMLLSDAMQKNGY